MAMSNVIRRYVARRVGEVDQERREEINEDFEIVKEVTTSELASRVAKAMA